MRKTVTSSLQGKQCYIITYMCIQSYYCRGAFGPNAGSLTVLFESRHFEITGFAQSVKFIIID